MAYTDKGLSPARAFIRAELHGHDTCTAIGITVQSFSPVLEMCRRLVAAGHDPDRPMHVYRGNALALKVRSLGEARNLEVNAKGTGFSPRSVRIAPSVRFSDQPDPKPGAGAAVAGGVS
jgi:hypothetical protein